MFSIKYKFLYSILLMTFSVNAWATVGVTNIVSHADNNSISPWDHGQLELKQAVTLPIKYPQAFTRERELFNYAPRFMPGIISFKPDNTPVMRVSVQGKLGEHTMPLPKRHYTKENYIQYLGKDGRWRATDSHVSAIKQFLALGKNEPLLILGGNRVADQVVFDSEGHAYTIASVQYFGKNKELLLYSNDDMSSWQVFSPKHSENMRIESFVTHNSSNKAPVIIARTKKQIYLIAPTKRDGKLILPTAVNLVTGKGFVLQNTMSGAGNHVVTINNKSFVVYMSTKAEQGFSGTPHYIVSYDHLTKEVSKPLFLGDSGHRIDGHNSPVILADSKGYLHVLLGTHWHSMVHLKSKNIADATVWHKPVYVAGNGDNSWSRNGITYPGFTIDKDDTLHLVVRGRNSHFVQTDVGNEGNTIGYDEVLDYALLYFSKKAGERWQTRKDLVTPKHKTYSNWYQKIAIDRKGNPYLTYTYYAHHLTTKEQQEYIQKWGGTGNKGDVEAHDPVLIRSVNHGDSWHIVQSQDFNLLNHKEHSNWSQNEK